MKLKLFNVFFGESILLECENGAEKDPAFDGLLVDCGSIRRKCPEITDICTMMTGVRNGWKKKSESKALKFTVGAMKNAMCRKRKSSAPELRKLSGMLTHYHKDHYSLFPDLEDVSFDTFYISNIAFLQSDPAYGNGHSGTRLTDEAILCYSYAAKVANSSEKENAVFFLAGQMKLLGTMVADGFVKILSQGDHFPVGKREFEVLWPPKLLSPDYFQRTEVSANLVQEMEELGRQVRTFSAEDYDRFRRNVNTIRNNMNKFYGRMADAGREGVRISSWEQLGALYKSQVDALEELGDIISRLPDRAEEEGKKYTFYVARLTRMSKMFKQDMNACSIVFRDFSEGSKAAGTGHVPSAERKQILLLDKPHTLFTDEGECNYLLLMTGDITRDIIEAYLYTPYFKGQVYYFLKCPHHGTYRDHYSNLLPACLNYLVSTGKGNSHFGKMAQAYYYHPVQIILRNRCYSTNCDWCEIYEAAGKIHACCPMSVVKRASTQVVPYIEVELT